MSDTMLYRLSGGGVILVETSDDPTGSELVGGPRDSRESSTKFREAMQNVRDFASDALDAVTDLALDEITLSFGIKFSAEKGLIVSKASLDAAITVTVKWTPPSIASVDSRSD